MKTSYLCNWISHAFGTWGTMKNQRFLVEHSGRNQIIFLYFYTKSRYLSCLLKDGRIDDYFHLLSLQEATWGALCHFKKCKGSCKIKHSWCRQDSWVTLSKSDILNRYGLAEEEVEEELWLLAGEPVAALPPPASYTTAPTATTPLMLPQTSRITSTRTLEKSHSRAPYALFHLQLKTDSQLTFAHTLGKSPLNVTCVLIGHHGRIHWKITC